MPFNVSGVFSRLYNWVADRDNGIKIMAARMDGEADDVAAAINAIVSQSQPFINPIKAPNGTVGAPGYSFDSDTNTGFYRVAENELGIVSNGVRVASATVNGLEMALPMIAGSGTAALPSVTFSGDLDTGVYRPSANQIGFATGGTLRATLSNSAFNVTVPITGDAVTQSDVDTTSGRLLKVGDYGLGYMILYSGNINTVGDMPTGFYRVTSSATGTFPSGLSAFNMIVIRRLLAPYTDTTQIAFRTAVAPEVFIRYYDGSSWSAWQKSYDQGNLLGTVSQSGGNPTGAVIERGINANGKYVRFADGTQICTKRISGIGPINTALGSGFVSGNVTIGAWAAAFTVAPEVSAAAFGNNTHVLAGSWPVAPTETTGGATQLFRFVTSSATDFDLSIVANGRWY